MDEPLTNTLNHTTERSGESLGPASTNGNGVEKAMTEDEIRGERLHKLIDREFLQILTEAEKVELEELITWRDEQKNAFYRQVALAQK